MEYSKERQLKKSRQKIPMKRRKKNQRSLATSIPPNVRQDVKVRDGKCIFCGSIYNGTMAHYIPRSAGGLGIKENLGWACMKCHHEMDHTANRPKYLLRFINYLNMYYPKFKDEDRKYNKFKGEK